MEHLRQTSTTRIRSTSPRQPRPSHHSRFWVPSHYQVDPLFHSNMNSLQVGAHKQYTNGIAFGAEYQWTRVLGTENLEDPSGKFPQDSYGNIGGITPDVLQLSYSYALPVRQGKVALPQLRCASPTKSSADGNSPALLMRRAASPSRCTYTRHPGALSRCGQRSCQPTGKSVQDRFRYAQ